MATVNFSVPEDVKEAFNDTFEGCNKSAIVADLLREAVEREKRRQAHVQALDNIDRIRATIKPLPKGTIQRALRQLRDEVTR
ncbi:MAG: hypothetical protein JSR27_01060 [Proteobacteria bacterium]|nr:hypothetical protein [Pseudomonadota bacterium]